MEKTTIIWKYGKTIDIGTINRVEERWKIKLPEEYVSIVKSNDGGYPSLHSPQGNVFNNLLSIENEDINYVYEIIKESAPSHIYPFARDPFGNYICFDYRESKSNPSIVFFDHQQDDDCIKNICGSFNEFLSILPDF